MSNPLRLQQFNSFLGSQEGIHSAILPEIFSSGGSRNLWIDKIGRARRIYGFSNQTTPGVGNNLGNYGAITGMFVYRNFANGTLDRDLILVNEDESSIWEIYTAPVQFPIVGTKQIDLGATPKRRLPDFCQYGEKAYITIGGALSPRSWNGSTLALAGYTQGPTPTAVAGAAGTLVGNYKYKLVSIVAATGARGAGSDASTVLALENEAADLSWTADPDTNVGGYELYRTTGTGNLFYFVTYIDGRTTVAYTDDTPDVDIFENRVMAEHGDPPPDTHFCEAHKGRVWWGRTDEFPTRVWWSDAGLPESVYAENYLDFADPDAMGDTVTGMIGSFEDRLVVFTERSVWTVAGSGQLVGRILDYIKKRSSAQIGAVSHRAAVKVPVGARFVDPEGNVVATQQATIAYFTPLGDIRLFDGNSDILISLPMKDTLAQFSYIGRERVHALHDVANQQIIWFFPISYPNDVPNQAVVWNYRWGVWYSWGLHEFRSSVYTDADQEANILCTGGSSGGAFFRYFDPNAHDFDGVPFNAIWMTKTLYGMDEQGGTLPTYRKRWRWADLLMKGAVGATLELQWLPGGALDDDAAFNSSAPFDTVSSVMVTADGSTILTADGSSIGHNESTIHKKILLQTPSIDYLHHEGLRLRLTDHLTDPDYAGDRTWSLEAFTLAYQLLPGLQRRVDR